MIVTEQPRTMRFPEIRQARLGMLELDHIKPLNEFRRRLAEKSDAEFPHFDPADGGINASILFLLEKPGPMTSTERPGRSGSGFISRDNDDPTAEATFEFMRQAGLPREETVLWNVVPGWNGTRAISAPELKAGVADVENLLALMHGAKAIVLVGKKARRAEPLLHETGLQIFHSPHPSPLVRASQPEQWLSIPKLWAEAGRAVL